MAVQKIRPFLWFGSNAEAAANFYVSIFKNSRIVNVMRSSDPHVAMGVELEIEGQQLIAFNGGPHFTLTEAVSMFVTCGTQAEVDMYWEKLTANGGAPSQCGWLKDQFGLSWQIIPEALTRLMGDKDGAKAQRVMQAMLTMHKIDIAGLQRAYDGE